MSWTVLRTVTLQQWEGEYGHAEDSSIQFRIRVQTKTCDVLSGISYHIGTSVAFSFSVTFSKQNVKSNVISILENIFF